MKSPSLGRRHHVAKYLALVLTTVGSLLAVATAIALAQSDREGAGLLALIAIVLALLGLATARMTWRDSRFATGQLLTLAMAGLFLPFPFGISWLGFMLAAMALNYIASRDLGPTDSHR